MAAYSIIIKNGVVFDGTGKPFQKADVGIAGDKIKKIGDLNSDSGNITIDATGKYISPGFLDLTTHSDNHWTLFSQPTQESFIRQGITTIFGGHGGSSLAPLVKAEDIQAIQKWTDISKININWQGMAEFLSELEKHKIAVNFGTLVGYGTLRRGIIGEAARPAQNDEITQMRLLAERAIKEGAFGISANLGAAHENSATNEEISEFLSSPEISKTIFSHHLEDEGKNILPALARLILFARNSGIRSHISHFKAIGKTSWSYFPPGLEMIEQAQKEGLDITCDFFPYNRTGSNLYMLLPDWAREGGKKHILDLIKGPERKNILADLKTLTLHYEKITIASTLYDFEAVGKTIKELSDKSGISPEEILLDLLSVNDLQVSIFNEAISNENIELLAEKNYSAVSSDGVGYAGDYRSKTNIPHPRSFGSFPAVFANLVKDKNILSWEKAIYKMTGLPAKIMKLTDRGIIDRGAAADIVVFDPEKIRDKTDYNNPYQFPSGVDFVIINGNIALAEGSLTQALAGRVLRRA